MALHEEQKRVAQGIDPRGLLWAVFAAFLGWLASLWVRFAPVIGAVSIIGFLAVMLLIDFLRPVHNWDMLAYLGVVARDWMGMTSPDAIHAFAYDTIRDAVGPDRYVSLTALDAYRERMAADPDAFVSMLGMYDVKWLYVALLALLGPLVGMAQAGWVINAAAALVLATGLIWWMRETGMLGLGLIAPALLMVAGIPGFAMVDLPDFLAFSLGVTGILLLDRDRVAGGLCLLLLSVAVRPDMIAFAGVLMAVAWFWRDEMTAKAALAFLASLVAFVAIETAGTNPGWWTHLWFSTYQMQNDMTGFHPDFSLTVYFTAVAWNLVRAALENAWLGLFALALLAWGLMQGAGIRMSGRRAVLVAALLAGIAAKFVVFPIHGGRFYIVLLFPAMLLLVSAAHDRFRDAEGSEART